MAYLARKKMKKHNVNRRNNGRIIDLFLQKYYYSNTIFDLGIVPHVDKKIKNEAT